jgi:protoporphyrinogen oxidase
MLRKKVVEMRVAIIGGGPSGLVTLKYLVTAHEFFPGTEPIEARLFEADDSVCGTFKDCAYEDAEVCPFGMNSYSSVDTLEEEGVVT